MKFTVNRKLIQDSSIQLKQNETSRLLIIQSLWPDKPSGEVIAFTPRYTFELTRPSKDHPWAIADVGDPPDPPLSKSTFFDIYEGGFNPLL